MDSVAAAMGMNFRAKKNLVDQSCLIWLSIFCLSFQISKYCMLLTMTCKKNGNSFSWNITNETKDNLEKPRKQKNKNYPFVFDSRKTDLILSLLINKVANFPLDRKSPYFYHTDQNEKKKIKHALRSVLRVQSKSRTIALLCRSFMPGSFFGFPRECI